MEVVWGSLQNSGSISTFLCSVTLGALVYKRNPVSWTNRLFAMLGGLIGLYVVVNYLSLNPPDSTPESQLFWIRVVMAVTSSFGPVLVFFAHTFPGGVVTMRWRMRLLLLTLMAASVTLSLSPYVFAEIQYRNGEPLPVPGPAMPVWVLNSLGQVVASFLLIAKKYREAWGEDRARYRLLLIGIVASFTLMAFAANIAVVAFNTSQFVFLGPISYVILVICVTVAIVRHQLFDLRIAGMYALIGGLWVLMLADLLVIRNLSEFAMDTATFSLALLTGILFIRTLDSEALQRKALEHATQELRQKNVELAESNQELERFTYVASHDLKTPLRAVTSFAELLQKRYEHVLDEKAREFLGFVLSGAKQMQELIEHLLALSRIDTSGGRFVRTDVGVIVHQVLQFMRFQIEEGQGAFVVGAMPVIVADPIQIGQLFQNLIGNALKFRGESSPRITLTATRGEGEWIFAIEDNGIGIDREDLDRIFEVFRRLHSQEIYPGTGIGLAICKKIVERHRGRIWVESTVGRGSSFLFSIPDASDFVMFGK